MRLHPEACEYYRLRITTEPAITPASWELSLDGGDTWHTATVLDDDSAWLVKGPDYEGESVNALPITRSTTTLIRAVDTPETVVRAASRIELSR